MASNLGNKIIQITANSQGVKAGVDQAQRELDRLSGVASRAGREIDSALNKLSESGGRRTTGTISNPTSAFDRFYRSPQFLANGREPLSRAIARTDFETAAKGFEQSLKTFAGLEKEFGIFSSVVKGAALKFRSAEAATEAAKDAQYRLASAINREVNAQNASLASRLASAGTRNGGSGIGVLRLTPLDDPDRSDANRILENIRSASAARRPIGPPPFSARRAQGELEEANKVRRDAYDREQAAKQIAETLEKQKRLEEEANRILAARNRVISGLASQRAAALADPKNLAALNRYERRRGQPLSTGIPTLREREPFDLAGNLQAFSSKVSGIAIGSFRRVGGFIVSEFTNFVSRVAANLTSRLIAGATEGLVTLAGSAIEAAKRYEDALVSFGVLAGGQDRGTSLVDELQKFAIDTPFKLQEVLDESKLLLSYGVSVDDLTKRLRQLGDVASGAGVDLGRLSLAFGQVLAKGRLQGPEIRQFTEAGVGIRDFVNSFNENRGGQGQERKVSTAGFLALVEAGEVSSKVVERAFDKMTSAGGRFFGFMEARSKTVSGRLNALSESLELIAQKIGKSLFERLGVGTGIDFIVQKLQGIDFSSIDKAIAQYAEPVQRFVVQVFSGAEAVFKDVIKNLFGSLNPKDFGQLLTRISVEIIPSIIRGAQTLVDVFLSVAQAALRFIQVVEIIATKVLPGDNNIGTTLTGVITGALLSKLAVAAAGTFLTATGVGTPLGLALLGLGTGAAGYLGIKASGLDLFGTASRDGSETTAVQKFTVALGEAQKRLEEFKPANKFQEKAKEQEEAQIKEALNRDFIRRQNVAKKINSDIINSRLNTTDRLGVPIDGNPFKRRDIAGVPNRDLAEIDAIENSVLESNRALDADVERAKSKILELRKQEGGVNLQEEKKIVQTILGQVKALGIGKFDSGVDSLVQLDKFAKLIKERTSREGGIAIAKAIKGVSPEDIGKIENISVKLGTAFQNLENKVNDLGDDTIPQFRKRLENINSDILKGKFDPVGDFKKDIAAIKFLSSPLARLAGIGITDEEANLARSERVKRLVEQFKPVEIKPAPLVRAGTQEAEQALTRAIYESRNVLSAKEQLNEALDIAAKATEENTKAIKENSDAVKEKKEETPFGKVVLAAFGL